jgi:hypothetical protein
MFDRERIRKNSEHRCAEADKHVGTQSRWPMLQFPLEPYDAAQDRGQHQTHYCGRDQAARHLAVHQIHNVRPVHGFDSLFGKGLAMAGFYHRIARARR